MWKKIYTFFNNIVEDTLKKNGKWSRTSLTMFTAWIVVLWSYHYDIVRNGFNLEAFCVLVGVALGSKVMDALSKRWGNGTNTAGNTENPQ